MISPQPYNRAIAIVKSDTVNLDTVNGTRLSAIYVGGAGNIVVVYDDGSTVTLTGCLAGTILPITCLRVNSTSTTATAMVGLYQILAPNTRISRSRRCAIAPSRRPSATPPNGAS